MSREPLVSIIVPVYNSERYCSLCIESCICQHYSNIEIILVDDGSVDSSLRICEEYARKDHRIQVIHQENAGVSAARNTGMRHAAGEYILFLDSDDELLPNTVTLLWEDMEKHDADIVSGTFCRVDQNGREYCRYSDEKTIIYSEDEPLIQSLKYDRHTNSACAKLYRKQFVEGISFVEGRHINEDGYFVFQCYVRNPKLVQHNTPVYRYYVRESSSTTGSFSEKFFDMVYFADMKMQYIMEHRPSLVKYAKEMEISTHLFLLRALCKDRENKYRKETRKSISIVKRGFLSYRSNNRHEKIMAAIVAFGLFPMYKRVFNLRVQMRK